MEGMKIPIRPAPEPPKVQWQNQNKTIIERTYTGDPFSEPFRLSRSQSTGKLGGNKKPPPRPPPPPMKLVLASRSSASNRKQPGQLMTGLFTRNKSVNSIPKSQTVGNLAVSGARKQPPQPQAPCGVLIDFSSPPSSPTLTAHSSSDGFSVNSFGSDSAPAGVLSTGSQIESGFEDDFDLLLASSSTTPSAPDLWGDDPFSNTRSTAQTSVPFSLSNEDPKSRHKAANSLASLTSTKPTIIRPKSNKPVRPPPPKLRPSSTPPTFAGCPLDQRDDWSPPMPSCPPPPPPAEALATLEFGPSLPPRPSTLIHKDTEKKKPYCIALYDYDAGHPDDLSFKVNDVIYLAEWVNTDWLRGSLEGRTGMFPASYANIVVPLEEPWSEKPDTCKYVIALYTFHPETWDDLPFQEGDTVKVIKRINNHWLYGECNGRQGQFPNNYVMDVSSFFPLQNLQS